MEAQLDASQLTYVDEFLRNLQIIAGPCHAKLGTYKNRVLNIWPPL